MSRRNRRNSIVTGSTDEQTDYKIVKCSMSHRRWRNATIKNSMGIANIIIGLDVHEVDVNHNDVKFASRLEKSVCESIPTTCFGPWTTNFVKNSSRHSFFRHWHFRRARLTSFHAIDTTMFRLFKYTQLIMKPTNRPADGVFQRKSHTEFGCAVASARQSVRLDWLIAVGLFISEVYDKNNWIAVAATVADEETITKHDQFIPKIVDSPFCCC